MDHPQECGPRNQSIPTSVKRNVVSLNFRTHFSQHTLVLLVLQLDCWRIWQTPKSINNITKWKFITLDSVRWISNEIWLWFFFWFPSLQSVCFAFILFLSIVTNRFSPNKEEYSVKLWWFIDGPADRYYIDNILSLNLIYFSSHFLFIADKIWNDWFCMSTRIVTFKFAVNFSMFSIRIEKILSNMRNESEHNICDLCAAFWLRVCAKMPRIHFENYQVYISCVSRSALKQGAINERTNGPTNKHTIEMQISPEPRWVYHLHSPIEMLLFWSKEKRFQIGLFHISSP